MIWHAAPAHYRRAFVVIIGLLLLGGCAGYRPQPIAPQETARAFAARALNDPGLAAYIERVTGAGPSARWDFPRLVLVAGYYNDALKLAGAQWHSAQAAAVAAGARPNPQVSALAQHSQNPPAGISPWTLGLEVDFFLPTAGRRDDRLAQAEARAEAARLRLLAARWRVASRLRRRLLALYRARGAGLILERLEAEQASYVALLERRQPTSVAPTFELAQMRLALEDTRLRSRAAEKQVAVSLARIADAIGLPVRALDGVDLSLSLFDHPALAAGVLDPGLRVQVLQQRPDLLAALADYAAAEAGLKLEVARQYPNLRLGPGYTWDEGQRKWSLALGFDLPVNGNRGPIAVARAAREEAAARFIALQDRVSGELDTASVEYAAALRELETADHLFAAAAARRRIMLQRIRPGVLSSVAELNTEIERERAAAARLDVLAQAQEAFGKLEDSVQQPLDPLELPLAPRAQGTKP